MGNPNLSSEPSAHNTESTHRKEEENFAQGLIDFNSELQADDTMKTTKLAKTWMSHLRRITNTKKDFDTRRR